MHTLGKKTIGRKLWNRVHQITTACIQDITKTWTGFSYFNSSQSNFSNQRCKLRAGHDKYNFANLYCYHFLATFDSSLFVASIGASLDEFSFEQENFGLKMNDLFVLSALHRPLYWSIWKLSAAEERKEMTVTLLVMTK